MSWQDKVVIVGGNNLEVLARIPDNSIDSVVTDPPYGLSSVSSEVLADTIHRWAAGDRDVVPDAKGFMGKSWDAFVPPPAVWDECFRVLKPGGHLLSFAGPRTQDIMGLSIRFAGFEIRDSVAYLHGRSHVGRNDQESLIREWMKWAANNVGVRFLDGDDGSVVAPVLLSSSLEKSPADVPLAELRSKEAHRMLAESLCSALSAVEKTIMELSALVSIAERSPANLSQMCTTGSSAPCDALGSLGEKTAGRLRGAEALRIWLGSDKSSKKAATSALCAALTDDLRLIALSQSETFQSYDTILQTVCVSATTATITASTAAHLISSMAATLAKGGDAEEASLPSLMAWVYGSGFP